MGEGGGGQGAGDLQMEGEQIPPFFSSRSLILTLPKGIYTWFVNQFRKTTLKVVKTEKYM